MSTFVGVTGFGNNKTYQGGALTSIARAAAYTTNSIIIRHSCVVLRRQCQVHDCAVQKHLLPHTLIPIIFKLTAKDGFFTLWKGTLGSGVLWGFSWMSELLIAEIFGLPKSYVPDGSSEKFWRHILLKASNFLFCTPLIVTNFFQTIRSWDSRDKDDSTMWDVLTHGFERFRQDFFNIRGRPTSLADKRRSIFWLALPTSIYHTAHFLICQYAHAKALNWTRAYVSRKLPSERKRYHTIMPELFSTMTACFVADLALYPLETVLHRLYYQGNAKIMVDNLDYGSCVIVPPAGQYKYDGIFDCFTSIIRNEGVKGLYSGIGAVLLQYALQFGFSIFVYWAMERVSSAGYTSGPLRVKTAKELIKVKLPDQPSTSAAAGCFTPFKSPAQFPQNPSAQFAANSISQQTSSSILNAADPTNGINNQDNPFFKAAIHRQRSKGGSMDNNGAGNSNDNPWGDDK